MPFEVTKFAVDTGPIGLQGQVEEQLPSDGEITDALYRHPADVWLVHRRSDGAVMAICPNKREMVKKMIGMVGEWRAVHRPDLTMYEATQLGHVQDELFGHAKSPGVNCAAKPPPSIESQARHAGLVEMRKQLAKIAARQPGINLREAIRQVPHHYESDQVARYALRDALRRHHIGGMLCRWTDDGRECCLWPEGPGRVV